MRFQHFFLILLASISSSTRAYDLQRAVDNFAEDASACVVFYTFVVVNAKQNAVQDKSWGELATKYEVTLNKSIELLRLAMTGKPEAYVQAKIDLRMQGSLKTLQSEGMDRLAFLYADSCKSLMENPDFRLEYWKKK